MAKVKVMWRTKIIVGSIPMAIAFATILSLAQDHAQAPIRVSVREVLVDVSVRDAKGQVIDGLEASDFVLTDDKTQQIVTYCSKDEMPLAVALVVDLSRSIKPYLEEIRRATAASLAALKAEDEVALFTFSTEVETRAELTFIKNNIAEQIPTFAADGGTNINGAIYRAAAYLRIRAPKGRRVILLISDNVPSVPSEAGRKEVLNAVLEADAVVYSVKVPGDNPKPRFVSVPGRAEGSDEAARSLEIRRENMETAANYVDVTALAHDTGGEVFDVRLPGSLDAALQYWVERMKTRYTLGFYPTNAVSDGKFHAIDVRLAPRFGKKGRDYSIRAKKGYFAPQEILRGPMP
jgi:VWFA-related protein